MKTANWVFSLMVCGALSCLSTRAATLYVWQESPSPASPFTNWIAAAHTIQDAVDAAQAGDTVLVVGGVYDTGGRAVVGTMTNRVTIDKAIRVESLMGPEVTVIQGYQLPGVTNGDGAIRCVYLASGASLSGFTLTNGATRSAGDFFQDQSGGGVCCENPDAVVSNCVMTSCSASTAGGGASRATLNNCTLTDNSAQDSGGAYGCNLNNCTLTGNWAISFGGGAYDSTLNNCVLIGNSAYGAGGAFRSTLTNCTLTGNSASRGGGADGSKLKNCTLTENWVTGLGGGAYESTLNNCTLTGNSATRGGGAYLGTLNACSLTGNSVQDYGGGAYLSTLNNCTLSDNSAQYGGGTLSGTLINCTLTGNSAMYGGGAFGGKLTNCIVYYNTANTGPDYDIEYGGSLNHCCTIPQPPFGTGNITNEPAFVDLADGDLHLRYGSPCIDAGTNLSATITSDLDGRPRPLDGNGDGIAVFDIGAYECVPVAHYVWQDSPNPAPPYTNWATAAHTIQEAVVAASAGDLVLVTNGVYSSVSVDKPVTLASVTGPAATVIDGGGTDRCVWLSTSAVLGGFTLTNGYGDTGGGIRCESVGATVSNCVLIGNSAWWNSGGGAAGGTLNNCILSGNSAQYGGGAYGAVLYNCALTGNSSSWEGGGAWGGTLDNCTLIGNSAELGGGAAYATLNNCTLAGNAAYSGGGTIGDFFLNPCKLNNCIVYYNTALDRPDRPNYSGSVFNYSCTTPTAPGVGNITLQPLFVDAAAGDFRLQPDSPCINAGNNSYVTTSTDLDGNPRIVSGTVDIGAYEYQGIGSIISYAWLQQYGLPTDGSVDSVDLDLDGLTAQQEWVADTNPTNAASVLRVTILSNSPPVAVTFSSSVARLYTLLSCSNLTPSTVWTSIPGQTDIPGTGDVLTLTDTNSPAPAFYRVSVRFP